MTTAPGPARRRVDRSDVVVGIAAIGTVALLVGLGLGLTFFADEWSVIADRSASIGDLLQPFNEHWLAVSIVVYRGMLTLFGLHSYVPYLALLAVLHATVAILVYTLVRRRTLRPVAVGVALIVLLFGSGFENLFWGIQIDFVGAAALGFGALLLLDDLPTLPGTPRAVAAAALLTIAVMTSGYGLFMLGLVALDVLLDARRRRWIMALLVPGAIYVAWYLAFGRSGLATHGNPFAPDRFGRPAQVRVRGPVLGVRSGGRGRRAHRPRPWWWRWLPGSPSWRRNAGRSPAARSPACWRSSPST